MAITLDTSVTGSASSVSSISSASITTAAANEILVACISCETGGGAPSITSVTGLGATWTKRGAYYNSANQRQEVWWALVPTSSSGVITANWSSTFDDAAIIVAAFAGCNTISPWDSNVSFPQTLTSTTGAMQTSVQATGSAGYYIGFLGSNKYVAAWPPPTADAVNVSQVSIGTVTNTGGTYYELATLIGIQFSGSSGIPYGYTAGLPNPVYGMFDALVAASTPAGANSGFFSFMGG